MPTEDQKHYLELEDKLRKELGLPSMEEEYERLKSIQEDKKLNPEKYPRIPVKLPKNG